MVNDPATLGYSPCANVLFSVDTLDHYEVPYIGRLANSFVDNE